MEKVKKIKKQSYPDRFDSIIDIFNYFNSEKRATQYYQHIRWQGKPICPHCYYDKICCFSDEKRFKCKGCKKQFTVRIGTLFQSSKISLRKWLIAVFLIASPKKGVSSHQLARYIKVTQKTALFMTKRIQNNFGIENEGEPMDGVIEADESFCGGRNKNRHFKKRCKKCTGRDWRDKTPVVGFVQSGKGGKARAFVTPDTKLNSIAPLIFRNVSRGAILVTDEYAAYKSMNKYVQHEYVEHRLGRYVNDSGFTSNAIEGLWAWLKRAITGTWHNVTRKYLQYYVNEVIFRFNTRSLSDGARFIYALQLNKGPLKYKNLLGKQ